MAWVELGIAGACEVLWAICLKYSNGFTKFVPSAITVVGLIASTYFLLLSVKTLPIGTAYAIWTGIGAVGTVVFGMILFHEPVSLLRIVFLLMIVGGIVGLKLVK